MQSTTVYGTQYAFMYSILSYFSDFYDQEALVVAFYFMLALSFFWIFGWPAIVLISLGINIYMSWVTIDMFGQAMEFPLSQEVEQPLLEQLWNYNFYIIAICLHFQINSLVPILGPFVNIISVVLLSLYTFDEQINFIDRTNKFMIKFFTDVRLYLWHSFLCEFLGRRCDLVWSF